MSADSSTSPGTHLRRIHAWLALWLSAYVLFHVWELWPALSGRDAYVARAVPTSLRGAGLVGTVALVLVPLAAYALLSLALLRLPSDAEDETRGSRIYRMLHAVLGITGLVFVGYHVVHAWAPGLVVGFGAMPYETLRRELGLPVVLFVYLLGGSAFVMALAEAAAAAASRLGLAAGSGARRNAKVTASIVALIAWLGLLNLIAHFARGEAFLQSHAQAASVTAAPPV